MTKFSDSTAGKRKTPKRLKRRNLANLSKAQLITLLKLIDGYAGPADSTRREPGIALSEATIRAAIDDGLPGFKRLDY